MKSYIMKISDLFCSFSLVTNQKTFSKSVKIYFRPKGMQGSRADCDAPCFEQLKATHLRASLKQQALLDALLQLIKTWPLTIGPWVG